MVPHAVRCLPARRDVACARFTCGGAPRAWPAGRVRTRVVGTTAATAAAVPLGTVGASGDGKKRGAHHAVVADVVAGLSVAFVTVPQSLAYAALAGVNATQGAFPRSDSSLEKGRETAACEPPPDAETPPGLYTNAVCSVPAAALSPSRYLQTGAVAMTSLLTCGCLTALGLVPHTADFAAAAALLAAVVGVARLVLGATRLGQPLVGCLPRAVLDGFGWGVVLLVAAAQVPAICGVPPPAGAHFISAAVTVLSRPAAWAPGTLAVAGLTAACLLGGKRIHPLFPGAIVATCIGCAASSAGLDVGPTVGAVRSSLPTFVDVTSLPWHLLPGLLGAGLAVALAGFAEAASISRRLAEQDGEEWDTNKELISQGAANLASAAFGGFPVGGSLSRTSLGRTAGATSQVAHAVTGLAVLAFLPLGASALSALPKAVLGALVACAMAPLMVPASSLWALAPGAPRREWRLPALGWATTAATLAVRFCSALDCMPCVRTSFECVLMCREHVCCCASTRQASPRLEYGLAVGMFLGAVMALIDRAAALKAQKNALPPVIDASRADVDGTEVVYAR